MMILEIEGKEWNVPGNWNEVSLEQFEKITKLATALGEYKSDIDYSIDMFSVITGAPREDLLKMTRAGFESLSKLLQWAEEEIIPSDKDLFVIEGEEWGVLKNLDLLKMGESVSLELVIKESTPDTILTNILPILIRPIKIVDGKKKLSDFKAEDYEETKELFRKNLTISDVISLRSFF